MLQSLALTGLGGLLAIVGTLLGHRRQAAEARHSRLEGYQREDRYRLHQERRMAYADFHLAIGRARSMVRTIEMADGDDDGFNKIKDARSDVWAALVPLWHVGSEEVVRTAGEFLSRIDAVMQEGSRLDLDQWKDLVKDYASAVRRDLLECAVPWPNS
ncbi:hypothetical protein HUT06_39520 [Actinomadura sp. NAK00032]|uniref:hypothetical protein n=1 Tax=Actinomadura sp. NAK00032 TaxID=2742128 RepID=UPI00158FC747|nr:hypothetical protein [Actinomadura sp. NAK00032]QKW39375.1 hypothetical protein HUT06_39520 [Actinomadura sp. NAK00032]